MLFFVILDDIFAIFRNIGWYLYINDLFIYYFIWHKLLMLHHSFYFTLDYL
jgi:hypothetical protein